VSIICDTFGDKVKLTSADSFETAYIAEIPAQGDVVVFSSRGGGTVARMIHACDLYFTPAAKMLREGKAVQS
jgi:hypothetical protein